MFCQNGHQNPAMARFCGTCGMSVTESRISEREYSSRTDARPVLLVKRSVSLLILLSVITLGIYNWVWFMNQRDGINALRSEEKLKKGVFIFGVAVQGAYFGSLFLLGIMSSAGEYEAAEVLAGLTGLIGILFMIGGVTFLIQVFKVRRILVQHYKTDLSGAMTFFFNVCYLQYRINRLG